MASSDIQVHLVEIYRTYESESGVQVFLSWFYQWQVLMQLASVLICCCLSLPLTLGCGSDIVVIPVLFSLALILGGNSFVTASAPYGSKRLRPRAAVYNGFGPVRHF